MINEKNKKRCSKCKQEKHRTHFYINDRSKDGLSDFCIMCIRIGEGKRVSDREYNREYGRRCARNLATTYVKHLIKQKYKIPYELISEDMIERERELIQINRLIKEHKNGNTKKINNGRVK